MLRFIHCADLHFDRTFEGLHLLADEVKQLPRENELVLKKIVDLAIHESVDLVLFAGDTFHQNRPTLKTQQLFFRQILRLDEAHIPVYLIFGNHDYYDSSRYWFDFPSNVHLFKEETVQTFKGYTKSGEEYAISGFSYLHPWIAADKVGDFPDRHATYHIGIYHGDMSNARFAPFKIQEMRNKNYDYWALGHIHLPSVLSQEAAVVYAGTPQGHTQKEDKSGINLVTITEQETSWQAIDVATIHWRLQKVSLQSISKQKQLMNKLKTIFSVSEKALVKLQLTEAGLLPENWLSELVQKELIAYLNHYLANEKFEQRVFQIETVGLQQRDKISLAASPEMGQQLFKDYQQTDVFDEVTRDLKNYPAATQVVDFADLRLQAFEQMQQKLTTDFSWEQNNENS